MHKTRLTVLTAFVATFSMLLSGLALADSIAVNDVETNGNTTLAPDSTGTAKMWLVVNDNNTDPVNGCNAQGNNPVTIRLSSDNPAQVSVNGPGTANVTDCYNSSKPEAQQPGAIAWIGYTVAANATPGEVVTLTATGSGGKDDGNGSFTKDSFTVTVASTGGGTSNPPSDPCDNVSNPAAPEFSAGPADGNNGWFTTVPSAAATSSTAGATISYATDGLTFGTLPTLGEGTTTVTAKATDGECGTKTSTASREFKIDTVAPSIQPGDVTNQTWRNNSLSEEFTASDTPGSGLANAADASFTLTASTDSTKNSDGSVSPTVASKTVTDLAGNQTTRSVSALIDTAKPARVEFVGGPAAGSTHWSTATPAAPSCTAADALSGLAGCVVTGYSTAVGTHTMTATATDNAGNTETATRSYTVRDLTHTGFYSPVVMTSGVYNSVKGGSTVPLKFNLQIDGVQQSDTTLVEGFSTAKIPCDGSLGEDPVDFVTTGSTTLRYDATAGQFIQNWKTPTSAGCYRATLKAVDGDTLTALFRIK